MPRSSTTPFPRRREQGFGVVEIVIAMFIMAILLIVMMKSFDSAKKATAIKEARAVASSYAQAISQYQADFANRNPTGAAWPDPKAGPLNLRNQPYMRQTPEAVTAGRVVVTLGCSAPSGSGTGSVSICLGTAPDYYIAVGGRQNSSKPWETCYMGVTPSTPKC